MMPSVTTPAGNPLLPFKLDFASGIVSLGSCFADEMGERLLTGGFHIEQNPFGTLYNPSSVASALERLIDDCEITEADLVQHEGLWHSWHHHGRFSCATPEETMECCNTRIHQAHQALCEADLLIVTLGSAWIFERKLENGEKRIVANCHKLPQEMFVRRKMSVDEVVALWTPLLQRLTAYYPKLHILFTVSPIRHKADGLHGNQLSKATLLLAIDQLLSSLPTLHYFPAYEIVLDELRDYRYFDPDMVHPSPLAVDIVWEYFQRATMQPSVREQAHFNMKQHKREQHIPLHQ